MFGKYRISNSIRFTAFLTISIILVFVWFCNITGLNDVSGSSEPEYITVTVKSGDSLWGLAEEFSSGKKDLRILVREIAELNDICENTLYAGQEIKIPC